MTILNFSLLFDQINIEQGELNRFTKIVENPDGSYTAKYKGESVAVLYFGGAVRIFVPSKITAGVIELYNKILKHLDIEVVDLKTDVISGVFIRTKHSFRHLENNILYS